MHEQLTKVKTLLRCEVLTNEEKMMVLSYRVGAPTLVEEKPEEKPEIHAEVKTDTPKGAMKLQDAIFKAFESNRPYSRKQLTEAVRDILPDGKTRDQVQLEAAVVSGLPNRYNDTAIRLGLNVAIQEIKPGIFQNVKPVTIRRVE